MPDDKATKPRYLLRRSSKNYLMVCEDDHCMCRICVKRPRGALDAQLILEALESYAVKDNGGPND